MRSGDYLMQIVKAARMTERMTIKDHPRPKKLAKELARHLPHHIIVPDEERRCVVLQARVRQKDRVCSTPESVCSPPLQSTCSTKENQNVR